jgi:hypothetical protein
VVRRVVPGHAVRLSSCVTAEGGAEHIEVLARRYLGTPYPWYGGRDQVRVILTIRADKIRQMG